MSLPTYDRRRLPAACSTLRRERAAFRPLCALACTLRSSVVTGSRVHEHARRIVNGDPEHNLGMLPERTAAQCTRHDDVLARSTRVYMGIDADAMRADNSTQISAKGVRNVGFTHNYALDRRCRPRALFQVAGPAAGAPQKVAVAHSAKIGGKRIRNGQPSGRSFGQMSLT
jgi:hypothetical protein